MSENKRVICKPNVKVELVGGPHDGKIVEVRHNTAMVPVCGSVYEVFRDGKARLKVIK